MCDKYTMPRSVAQPPGHERRAHSGYSWYYVGCPGAVYACAWAEGAGCPGSARCGVGKHVCAWFEETGAALSLVRCRARVRVRCWRSESDDGERGRRVLLQIHESSQRVYLGHRDDGVDGASSRLGMQTAPWVSTQERGGRARPRVRGVATSAMQGKGVGEETHRPCWRAFAARRRLKAYGGTRDRVMDAACW
ncbi:hypothetical protein B0H12DRAFT_1082206 [Mycena haematopus]|nr:hypothetical protein B0H12DRAFT_1082206 [Mycena haematopus]